MQNILILFMALLVTACGHQPLRTIPDINSHYVNSDNTVYEEDLSIEENSISGQLPIKSEKTISIANNRGQDPVVYKNEIPDEYNKYVKRWMDYFQGRGRGHMRRYLQRSGRYVPVMKEILRSHGLPEDLVYVALIESGFRSAAKSRASAVGYWQFMRYTGKDYGLKINYLIDERRDPIKSTHAAAKYLKGLYNLFGSWYLAIASYNSGENRVKRVVMKNSSRNFWDLVVKKKLPSETINYVPKFLAARKIARDPEKYGFYNIAYDRKLSYEMVASPKPVSISRLASEMKVSLKEMKRLNPEFIGDLAPIYRGRKVQIKIPMGSIGIAERSLPKSYSRNRRVATTNSSASFYKVRSGDNLIRIARKHGTSVSKLRSWNNLSRKSIIRTGSRLRVRAGKSVARSKSSKSSSGSLYKVRRGDNLIKIARKFGTSVSTLKRMNSLNRKAVIRTGGLLRVPSNNVYGMAYKDLKSSTKSSKSYTIKPGDNLIRIARSHGVSLSKLRSANRLTSRSKIFAGKRLVIPR